MRVRLLSRILLSPSAASSCDRPAGLMEQWYMAQPTDQKRTFIQSMRIRGVRPSLSELHAALSYVACEHPTLLVLPSHDCMNLGMQISKEQEQNIDGTIPFPLKQFKDCISISSGNLDDIIFQLLNQPSETDVSQEVWSQHRTRSIEWKAIRVILLEKEPNEPLDEFTIVIRVAHLVGDGLSLIAIFRHLLRHLHRIRREGGLANVPKTIPAEAITSIATYPSMDDLLDYRPTVGRLLEFIWESKIEPHLPGYLQSNTSKLNAHWWNGRSLIDEKDTDSIIRPSAGTSFVRVSIDARRSRVLRDICTRHGATLHGLLTAACAYAAGIVGRRDIPMDDGEITLKFGTPFGVRRLLQQSSTGGQRRYDSNDLVGNYFGSHTHFFTLRDHNGMAMDSIWIRARVYLNHLSSDQSHDLQSAGLLGFVDPREFVSSSVASLWRGRSATCEVSDIGMVDRSDRAVKFDGSDVAVGDSGMTLLSARFTQAAHYQAAVFANSMIETSLGGICIMTSYSNQVVSLEDVTLYRHVLEYVITKVEESGECSYRDVRRHNAKKGK